MDFTSNFGSFPQDGKIVTKFGKKGIKLHLPV